MPIYEYACAQCGPYEVTQKITEPPLTRCEKCGGKKIQRLISSTSFALKGGGWYSDLYGSSKSSPKGSGGGGKSAA